MKDFDVIVIGSGAGGGPVAYELAQAGYSVLVLEKGPWFTENDFSKDEITCCRRRVYTPRLQDEQHVIERSAGDGEWEATATYDSGVDFWNGNMVGGSSNLMSGYFHRLKPRDFRLLSEFGPIEGANIADWPISYDDLEPYYRKVEEVVGVSGKVVQHPHLEPRSSKDFPFAATLEHPISQWIDNSAKKLGYHPIPVPRAILPYPALQRGGCSYSNFCGSYGCSTKAKGSARAALIDPAVRTGNCQVWPHSKVYKLFSDTRGRVNAVGYFDKNGNKKTVTAKMYVVACQAIETARLLLASGGPKHLNGLGNNSGQVGKNLLFSAGGSGTGDFPFEGLDPEAVAGLKVKGLFVNRALQDWYYFDDPDSGKSLKGGTIDFLFRHANGISRANSQKWGADGLVWGSALKSKMKSYFTEGRYLRFEVFNDWLPTDDCFVSLDSNVKDKWGSPVARFRTGYHPHDLKVGRFLAAKAENVLREMGAKNIRWSVSGAPPPNLQAGGARFGNDPKTSVLDKECRVHDCDNLFVTDGSFMPTGGSVPYTWTIYANAFRVADAIKKQV